jgi:hypothetical protein
MGNLTPITFTAEQMEALMRFTFLVSHFNVMSASLPPADLRMGPIIEDMQKAERAMLDLFLTDVERNRFRTIAKAAQAPTPKPRIIL